MSRLKIVAVSGSTRRPSRTTELVAAIGREVAARRGADIRLVDLADIGPGLAAFRRDGLPEQALATLAEIEKADALIVGAPVYKGSYPGLFKHLFDFVEPAALAGTPVILAATGGGRRHALVVEHQLRPLFGFFAALTLPTSIYASDEDFQDGELADPVTLGRISQAAAELASFARPATRDATLIRAA
ncbi:FMN reductase [Enterovirga aerilata]|uniref:FMN reductase n=1 Tax=Enterovirga aerilata TaxID=2730920 RepID=A0A849I4M8_9HYPH|nr:FMN reductase [Enterovirga sp. DB1703]NNM71339.1 FMN reductase [Enterovirga sp. DB1703]